MTKEIKIIFGIIVLAGILALFFAVKFFQQEEQTIQKDDAPSSFPEEEPPEQPKVLAQTAVMGLMPRSGLWRVGENVVIDIVINTQGYPIDGVDIRYLVFDPDLVEVLDSDANAPGVQIEAGTLMPLTVSNSADAQSGKIVFSQIVSGGTKFQNSSDGVLARIHLKAKKSGRAVLRFDFTPQDTRDANITSGGKDILSSVQNGEYSAAQ